MQIRQAAEGRGVEQGMRQQPAIRRGSGRHHVEVGQRGQNGGGEAYMKKTWGIYNVVANHINNIQ